MPASSSTSACRAGGTLSATPSASRQSAVPERELAARLPCLITRAPAPAAVIPAIVEMLTVAARSPPVPTMSTPWRSRSMGVALARVTSSRVANSAGDSPLARSSTEKAAIWAAVASPDRIRPIAQRN